MGPGDGSAQVKAQAHPACAALARCVGAVEGLSKTAELGLLDAGAEVPHHQAQAAVDVRRGQLRRGRGGPAVSQGVVDQVAQQ